jgi:hypothetical protein
MLTPGKAHSEGVAMCLEAINAKNVSRPSKLHLQVLTKPNISQEKIYSHLGFETRGEGKFIGKYGEFTFWVMIAEAPNTSATATEKLSADIPAQVPVAA